MPRPTLVDATTVTKGTTEMEAGMVAETTETVAATTETVAETTGMVAETVVETTAMEAGTHIAPQEATMNPSHIKWNAHV